MNDPTENASYIWKDISTAPAYPVDIFYVNGSWDVPATGILRRAVRRREHWEESDGKKGIPAQFVILWREPFEESGQKPIPDTKLQAANRVRKSKPGLKVVK